MEYWVYFKTNEAGDVVGYVGIRKLTPQDRILGFAHFPAFHPSPEIQQALKDLVAQAKREESI
jgi:hypothetical protein